MTEKRMPSEAFRNRILNDLLPAFCNDPARRYDRDGFKSNCRDLHAADAEDFLTGLDAGLVQPAGNMYRAPRSGAGEQLFTEGHKKARLRSITLWAEPIITIATLSRLHFDFGWPKELLGTQSSDGAFDVIAFLPTDLVNEHLACEVKKTERELGYLIQWMQEFGVSHPRDPTSDNEKNAYRKVAALRLRRAPLFWAVGPGGSGTLFKVSHPEDGQVVYEQTDLSELRYPGQPAG